LALENIAFGTGRQYRNPANFELDLERILHDNLYPQGVVAQLGEHLTGSQEVTGSSPVNSTIFLFIQ
jgi:hypothetical protein